MSVETDKLVRIFEALPSDKRAEALDFMEQLACARDKRPLPLTKRLELFVGRVAQLKNSKLYCEVLGTGYGLHKHYGKELKIKRPTYPPDYLVAFLTWCRPLISDGDGISCRELGEQLDASSVPSDLKATWKEGRELLNEFLEAPPTAHVEVDPKSNRELIWIFAYGEHIHIGARHRRSKFENFTADVVAEILMESELLRVLGGIMLLLEQFEMRAQRALGLLQNSEVPQAAAPLKTR